MSFPILNNISRALSIFQVYAGIWSCKEDHGTGLRFPQKQEMWWKKHYERARTHRKAGSSKEGHPNVPAHQINLVEVYTKPEQNSQLQHFWPGKHLPSNKENVEHETRWPESFLQALTTITIPGRGPSQNWWCFPQGNRASGYPNPF